MILRRRLWSVFVLFICLVLIPAYLFAGQAIGLSPKNVTRVLIAAVMAAAATILLAEMVFITPLRHRLRRLSDLLRTMDPTPPPPRVRGTDDLEDIRQELRRMMRRFDETRGDLAMRRIRAEADSRTDALTGLYNRRSFDRFLLEEWDTAKRARMPVAMLILDVDRFKNYNDTFGHPVGNQVLERLSTLIKESVRATDLLFRYAGDEFAVLLPKTGLEQAVMVAEKIRQRVNEQQLEIEGSPRQLSVSIGAAELLAEMRAPEDLVQLADRALYYSKEAGRNVVSYPYGRGVFRVYKPE